MEALMGPMKVSKTQDATTLPEDLIFMNILPRIPAKSVLRFKSVSKQWRNFIANDDGLKKAHTRHNHTSDGISIIVVMTTSYDDDKLLFLTGEHCLRTQTDKKISPPRVKELKLPSKEEYWNLEDIASSNGLVLHSTKKQVTLWNPIIGESRALPEPEIFGYQSNLYLGFDIETGDHKVLRVADQMRINYNNFNESLNLKLFSRKSGSWKELQNIPGLRQVRFEPRRQGVSIGSALYFFAVQSDPRYRIVIVWFSCRDDKVQRVIDVPDRSDGEFVIGHESQLGRWKEDSLAVTSMNFQNWKIEFWMMIKDDGFRWSKLFVISYCHYFRGVWNDQFLIVQTCNHSFRRLEKRELVLMDGEKGLYCTLTRAEPGSKFKVVIDYVPSLFSVYPDPCF